MLGRLWRIDAYSPRFWSGLVQSNGGVRICSDTKGKFWKILRNSCLSKSYKVVLDSMLYENPKWYQIAPFCISSKKYSGGRHRPLTLPSQKLWRAHYLVSATSLLWINNSKVIFFSINRFNIRYLHIENIPTITNNIQ
jgi:hypothetical protein